MRRAKGSSSFARSARDVGGCGGIVVLEGYGSIGWIQLKDWCVDTRGIAWGLRGGRMGRYVRKN